MDNLLSHEEHLKVLSKNELIERILRLQDRKERQSEKLQELEQVIKQRNQEFIEFESELKEQRKEAKSYKKSLEKIKNSDQFRDLTQLKNTNGHYLNLINNYRREIADLKEEIEEWKVRYSKK